MRGPLPQGPQGFRAVGRLYSTISHGSLASYLLQGGKSPPSTGLNPRSGAAPGYSGLLWGSTVPSHSLREDELLATTPPHQCPWGKESWEGGTPKAWWACAPGHLQPWPEHPLPPLFPGKLGHWQLSLRLVGF